MLAIILVGIIVVQTIVIAILIARRKADMWCANSLIGSMALQSGGRVVIERWAAVQAQSCAIESKMEDGCFVVAATYTPMVRP